MIPLSYNIRSILRRRFSAFATAIGLGLVVFVFAAVLMLAHGVEETLKSTGVRENAILLRKGSTSELTSFLPREAAKTFAADPAVAVEGGKQVASPELFVIFQLQRVDKSGTANVGIRGVTKAGWDLLRSRSIKLVDGRPPQWATSEIMIGRAARGRYLGAEIGQSITIARRQWQVVGVLEAGGAAFESEIWADADQIADARIASDRSAASRFDQFDELLIGPFGAGDDREERRAAANAKQEIRGVVHVQRCFQNRDACVARGERFESGWRRRDRSRDRHSRRFDDPRERFGK